ncbi:hypothetical protein, partial [Xanthomonas sp. WHRI 8356]|uniref:hypothetical protein n=1 Tax=Xanthomonas sp. WHRI 8356 TaxID=3161571 RepID=UPI0032E8692F
IRYRQDHALWADGNGKFQAKFFHLGRWALPVTPIAPRCAPTTSKRAGPQFQIKHMRPNNQPS